MPVQKDMCDEKSRKEKEVEFPNSKAEGDADRPLEHKVCFGCQVSKATELFGNEQQSVGNKDEKKKVTASDSDTMNGTNTEGKRQRHRKTENADKVTKAVASGSQGNFDTDADSKSPEDDVSEESASENDDDDDGDLMKFTVVIRSGKKTEVICAPEGENALKWRFIFDCPHTQKELNEDPVMVGIKFECIKGYSPVLEVKKRIRSLKNVQTVLQTHAEQIQIYHTIIPAAAVKKFFDCLKFGELFEAEMIIAYKQKTDLYICGKKEHMEEAIQTLKHAKDYVLKLISRTEKIPMKDAPLQLVKRLMEVHMSADIQYEFREYQNCLHITGLESEIIKEREKLNNLLGCITQSKYIPKKCEQFSIFEELEVVKYIEGVLQEQKLVCTLRTCKEDCRIVVTAFDEETCEKACKVIDAACVTETVPLQIDATTIICLGDSWEQELSSVYTKYGGKMKIWLNKSQDNLEYVCTLDISEMAEHEVQSLISTWDRKKHMPVEKEVIESFIEDEHKLRKLEKKCKVDIRISKIDKVGFLIIGKDSNIQLALEELAKECSMILKPKSKPAASYPSSEECKLICVPESNEVELIILKDRCHCHCNKSSQVKLKDTDTEIVEIIPLFPINASQPDEVKANVVLPADKSQRPVTFFCPKWKGGASKEKEILDSALCHLFNFLSSLGGMALLEIKDERIGNWYVGKFVKWLLVTLQKYLTTKPENTSMSCLLLLIKDEKVYDIVKETIADVYKVDAWAKSGNLSHNEDKRESPTEEEPTGIFTISKKSRNIKEGVDSHADIAIVTGTLLEQQVEVIVNLTTKELNLAEGYLTKIILDAAGNTIQDECRNRYQEGIKLGEIAITSAGKLKFRRIFHGALCLRDANDSHLLSLRSLMKNCLKKAREERCQSIAFPALGIGRLKYPVDVVAKEMFRAVTTYAMRFGVKRVKFVLPEKYTDCLEAFKEIEKTRNKLLQDCQDGNPGYEASLNDCTIKIAVVVGKKVTMCDVVIVLGNPTTDTPVADISFKCPKYYFFETEKKIAINRDPRKWSETLYLRLENGVNLLEEELRYALSYVKLMKFTSCAVDLSHLKKEDDCKSMMEKVFQVVNECKSDPGDLERVTILISDDILQKQILFSEDNVTAPYRNKSLIDKFNVFPFKGWFGSKYQMTWKMLPDGRLTYLRITSMDMNAVKRSHDAVQKEFRKRAVQTTEESVKNSEMEGAVCAIPGEIGSEKDSPEKSHKESRVHLKFKAEVEKGILDLIRHTTGEEGVCVLVKDLQQKADVEASNGKVIISLNDFQDANSIKMCAIKHYQEAQKSQDTIKKRLIDGGNADTKELLQFAYSNKGWDKKLTFEEGNLYLIGTLKLKEEVDAAVKTVNKWCQDELFLTVDEQKKAAETLSLVKKEFPAVFIKQTGNTITIKGDNADSIEKAKHRAKVALGRIKLTSRNKRRNLQADGESFSSLLEDDRMEASPASLPSDWQTSQNRAVISSKTFYTREGITVKVYAGDIVRLPVDCIVNAANKHLSHGGGVALAIAKAAGRKFDQESEEYVRKHGIIPVTECCVTSAGRLPYKCVIHVVGPQWHDYTHNEKDKCTHDLKKTVINCLSEANKLNITSIAVTSISSGIFGVPKNMCTQMYVNGVVEFSRTCNLQPISLREIHFVDMLPEMCHLIQLAFDAELNTKSNNEPMIDTIQSQRKESSLRRQELPPFKTQSEVSATERPLSCAEAAAKYYGCDTTTPVKLLCEYIMDGIATVCSEPHMVHVNQMTIHLVTNETSLAHQLKEIACQQFGQKIDVSGPDSLNVTIKNYSECIVSHNEPPRNHLDGSKKGHENQTETCPICLDTPVDPKAFNGCGHILCRECMEFTVKNKPVCPVCGKIYGIIMGNQPVGTMHVTTYSINLPGFKSCGTIDILYSFPGGIQTEGHPNPGKRYYGTSRRAYLPDNTEGRNVLSLLRKAFDRRLVFTVGRSVTTGTENTVTWNDIHHKTHKDGGPQNNGYPDPDYLRRVREELAAKGVTEDT